MLKAIIQTGGKQFHVAEGDIIQVEKQPGVKGDSLEFRDVLMVSGAEGGVKVGQPRVSGAKVVARILRQDRSRKIVIYTFKCRKGFSKKRGHRQPFTEVRIEKIQA